MKGKKRCSDQKDEVIKSRTIGICSIRIIHKEQTIKFWSHGPEVCMDKGEFEKERWEIRYARA